MKRGFNITAIKSEFDPESHLLPCPFSDNCSLPKREDICTFPTYKECAEYREKVKKLKIKGNI
jgi:hypothetical protein